MSVPDRYLPSANSIPSGLDLSRTAGLCFGDGCNGVLHPTPDLRWDGRAVVGCDACGRRFVRREVPDGD